MKPENARTACGLTAKQKQTSTAAHSLHETKTITAFKPKHDVSAMFSGTENRGGHISWLNSGTAAQDGAQKRVWCDRDGIAQHGARGTAVPPQINGCVPSAQCCCACTCCLLPSLYPIVSCVSRTSDTHLNVVVRGLL